MTVSPANPNLRLVTCGGTIAMSTGVDGLRRPASPEQVAAVVQRISGAVVKESSAGDIDSSQAGPAEWEEILAAVRAAQTDRPDPVIVTHGTDSLAWTAGMLAAAGPWPAPVVLTAANIPLGEARSDAEANLAAAVAAARSGIPEVLVVFAGAPTFPSQVFQGGFVRKCQAGGAAFIGLPRPIGQVRSGRLEPDAPLRAVPVSVAGPFDRHVVVVSCNPMMDAHPYVAMITGPAAPDAVVLETYACGTVPAAAVHLAAACRDAGIPVLACPPSPITTGDAVYPSTQALVSAGADVRLNATLELLVPFAASRPR